MNEEQETQLVIALSRIETKLDRVLEDHEELEVEVKKNSRFRIAATAIGTFAITVLSWLGLK